MKWGSKNIKKPQYGSKSIVAAYWGNKKVWDKKKPNIISFTIDGTAYQAEEEMTWEEWVDSEYNVDGKWKVTLYYTIGYQASLSAPGVSTGMKFYTIRDVTPEDTIINKFSYQTFLD